MHYPILLCWCACICLSLSVGAKFNKAWQTRFFVLKVSPRLFYYKQPGDKEEAGVVDLETYSDVHFFGTQKKGKKACPAHKTSLSGPTRARRKRNRRAAVGSSS